MAAWDGIDAKAMTRALELAARGQGFVEPNPMVGCAIVREGVVVGEGWHQRFGGPHAEIEALAEAGDAARGAALYVTLEPCCHFGKTPPCTQALVAAGIHRVVAAQRDPFPLVDGGGLRCLVEAGIEVEVGLLEDQARKLNAPYLKLLTRKRPWIIAKWAMTLDGKLATRSGDSRWISSEASRAVAHQLRGRVDAIVVGRGTAAIDDPLLTARPPGPRTAVRVLVDSRASLSAASQLVRTAQDVPVLIAVGPESSSADRQRLIEAGCEVLISPGATYAQRLTELLVELGRRRFTNVLVEGGGRLLGSLFDSGEVDEVHVFIATKLIGGNDAPSPVEGRGFDRISQALELENPKVERLGDDLYVHGRRKLGLV